MQFNVKKSYNEAVALSVADTGNTGLFSFF